VYQTYFIESKTFEDYFFQCRRLVVINKYAKHSHTKQYSEDVSTNMQATLEESEH